MSLSIGPTPPPPPLPPERPGAAGHATPALGAAFRVDPVEVAPAAPPAGVRDEVRFAAQRAAELAADDRELHFTLDAASHRVIVQVRDLEGRVLATIPPSRALRVAGGEAL